MYCGRVYFIVLALIVWVGYQLIILVEHDEFMMKADPFEFVRHFNIVGIERSNLHSKTLEYWMKWFNQRTIQQVGNKTFTLFHFDYHPNYDITHDPIHPCSPSQLIYYHQLVEQVRYENNK